MQGVIKSYDPGTKDGVVMSSVILLNMSSRLMPLMVLFSACFGKDNVSFLNSMNQEWPLICA